MGFISSIFSTPEPEPVVITMPTTTDTAAEQAAAAEAAAQEAADKDAAAKEAAMAEAENLRKRKGAASTIKTSSAGILESAPVTRKELLG